VLLFQIEAAQRCVLCDKLPLAHPILAASSLTLRCSYTVYTATSSPDILEKAVSPEAWLHFRLSALVLAAGFCWVFNLVVFASFGINWKLIFGKEIAGAAAVSAATIARVCGAATLWLWICIASHVQNLVEQKAVDNEVIDVVNQSAYLWPQVASASIVGLPLLLLLLPLPVLAWRSRFSWFALMCKMVAVPLVEVPKKHF
jgi:hypothetical protein